MQAEIFSSYAHAASECDSAESKIENSYDILQSNVGGMCNISQLNIDGFSDDSAPCHNSQITEKASSSFSENEGIFTEALKGNFEAFNVLLARYYPVVARIAAIFFHRYRNCFFYQDADDITQNVMLRFQKILENYAAFSRPASFENFLAGCIRNVTADMARSNIAERGSGRRKLDHHRICSLIRLKKADQDFSHLTEKAPENPRANQNAEITPREIQVLELIQTVLRANANAKKYLSDEEIFEQSQKHDGQVALAEIKNLMDRFEAKPSFSRAPKSIEELVRMPEDEVEQQRREVRRGLREFQKREPAFADIIFSYYWQGRNDTEMAIRNSRTKIQIWRDRQKALERCKEFLEQV